MESQIPEGRIMTRRLFPIFACLAAFAGLAPAADDTVKVTTVYPAALRQFEPPDNVIVTLPAPPPPPVVTPAASPGGTVPPERATEEPRPYLRRIKREYPEGFEAD